MNTRIILARHGETNWNREGRYQGRMDIPLNELGVAQGKALGEALKNVHIDYFVSTPLSRAKDTCMFCASLHNQTKIDVDPRLIEISHGKWEGMLSTEIEKTDGATLEKWKKAPSTVAMPEGESLEDVRLRTMEAMEDIGQKYAGYTTLVVAHDAVNKAFLCHVLGIALDRFWQIKQDNTGINVFEYDPEKNEWRVILVNNTNHLGYLYSGIEQKGL